jgi:hypothetical protein
MWFKELCESVPVIGGISILLFSIPDIKTWVKITVGIVLIVVGAIVALH